MTACEREPSLFSLQIEMAVGSADAAFSKFPALSSAEIAVGDLLA